jgi:hypothetical protein
VVSGLCQRVQLLIRARGARLAAGRCFGPPTTAARNAPLGVRRVRSPRYHSYHLSNGC